MVINLSKKFNELTEIEKMILALKGAINEIKKDPQQELFYGYFIAETMKKLRAAGLTNEDIFNSEFKN